MFDVLNHLTTMFQVSYTICDGDIDMPSVEFSTLSEACNWLHTHNQPDWSMQTIEQFVDGQWAQTPECLEALFNIPFA